MKGKLIFAVEVASDLQEAYDWYEVQRIGLGEDFLVCVEAKIEQIRRSPNIYEMVYKNFRRALVRRFPYAIFYENLEETIYIYSIVHQSQNPLRWKDRLS